MSQALDLQAVLPIIKHYVVVQEGLPEQLRDPDAADFAEEFEWMGTILRTYAHETTPEVKAQLQLLASLGETTPLGDLLPSPSQLRQMQIAGNGAIFSVNIVDPTWLSAFVATLPPNYQKQVQGSIKNQQLRTAMIERRASRR